jgi:hypothetical protein
MNRKHSRTWYAAIACIAFLICTHVTDLMRLAGARRFIHGWASLGVANLLQVILSVWVSPSLMRQEFSARSKNWDCAPRC